MDVGVWTRKVAILCAAFLFTHQRVTLASDGQAWTTPCFIRNIPYTMRAGTLLISQPFLGDPNFERSVVLLCRHTRAAGTFGLVLNRLTPLTLGEVLDVPPAFAAASNLPMYVGGPVEPNTLHFLHRRADLPGARDLGDGVYWGGDFNELLGCLCADDPAPGDVRLFAGYSGWSAGQLAGEMERGSWITQPASAGKVFTLTTDAFWREVLREKGGRFKVLANYPTDPRLN